MTERKRYRRKRTMRRVGPQYATARDNYIWRIAVIRLDASYSRLWSHQPTYNVPRNYAAFIVSPARATESHLRQASTKSTAIARNNGISQRGANSKLRFGFRSAPYTSCIILHDRTMNIRLQLRCDVWWHRLDVCDAANMRRVLTPKHNCPTRRDARVPRLIRMYGSRVVSHNTFHIKLKFFYSIQVLYTT